jgi:hypothetical protein
MYMALLKVCAQMPRLAGIMLVRRGETMEGWSDPKAFVGAVLQQPDFWRTARH